MHITTTQAIWIGIYYWQVKSFFKNGRIFNTALISCAVTGLILGDIHTGIKYGAVVQALFLGLICGYGSPEDQSVIGIISVVMYIKGGLRIEIGYTFGTIVVLLFSYIQTLRSTLFSYTATLADKAAAKGNGSAIFFYGFWFSWLSNALMFGLPMMLFLKFAINNLDHLPVGIPSWIFSTLRAIPMLLPTLGIAMTIKAIGRSKLMPVFLFGYFLTQYRYIGSGLLAITGLFIAFLCFLIRKTMLKNGDSKQSTEVRQEEAVRILSKRDVTRVYFRWLWFANLSTSFARFQAVAFCCAFIPVLKKLYGNDLEEYKAALSRHLMFFDTDGIWGSLIHGIVLSMEEQRAMGTPIDPAAIIDIKTGLMLPLGSIGNSINWYLLSAVFTYLTIPIAETGSIWGPVLQVVLVLFLPVLEGLFFCHCGYRLGAYGTKQLMQNSSFTAFLYSASVFGLFMLGGLSASYVNVTTPLWFATTNPNAPLYLQAGILDKIAPGVLPLVAILLLYRFLQKGHSSGKVTAWFFAIGFLLSAIGLIGQGGFLFKAFTPSYI